MLCHGGSGEKRAYELFETCDYHWQPVLPIRVGMFHTGEIISFQAFDCCFVVEPTISHLLRTIDFFSALVASAPYPLST
jgi:hypothetical protein